MKQITHFICQQCGSEFPKWQGQCSQCGKWNSLVETTVSPKAKSLKLKAQSGEIIEPLRLSEIKSKTFSRVKTGIGELDRVLGGGIVPGSVVLVAGEPGIGKSTLLTHLALKLINSKSSVTKFDSVFESHPKKYKRSPLALGRDAVNTKTLSNLSPSLSGKKILNSKFLILNSVLYVCGEESPEQIKLRIDRFLNSEQKSFLRQAQDKNLLFLPETNIENILASLEGLKLKAESFQLIIVDSIQTLWTENLTGTAGSVGQVRECSNMLLNLAKKTNIPIFLVGHITKEGMIAGPKVLEHLVDTVLYLEGEREHDFRILRAVKNRFGPTDEVGVFTMEDRGLKEVSDASMVFLSQTGNRRQKPESGKAITISMQGIRPMLVEIQALVVPSNLAMPRRVASGISFQKLQLLCAVIQKKLGLPLYQSDVFVNVVGGLKISEPAADLAVAMAIVSSVKNKPLPLKSVVLGEVGLLGEIRRVSFMEKRIKEAKKLGYKIIIGEKEFNLRQILAYLK